MKKGLKKKVWWLGWLAGATVVVAQDPSLPPAGVRGGMAEPGIRFHSKKAPQRNQVSVGYRMGINVAVDFKGMGGFAPMTDPGPATGGGVDRFYDNGANQVDSSGNSGGVTWFWGYGNGAQVPGNDTLVMDSNGSTSRANKLDVDENLTHGPEVTYRRDIDRLWKGRWGVEGSFAYTWMDVQNNSMFNNTVTILSDAYVLNGVIPPQPPYQGTANGPGPVISDSPQRVTTVSTQGALVVGTRTFEADLYNFRLGPYWEIPLHDRVAVSLSGGLALTVVDGEFSYRESVSITGAGTRTRAGSDSQTDLAAGGYVAATLVYALREQWDLYGSVQYVNLGHYEQSDADRDAVVDFDDSIYFSVGVGYRF